MGICGSTATVPSELPPPQPAPQRSAPVQMPPPQTSREIASAPSSQAVTRTRSRARSTTQRSKMSSSDSNPRSRTRSEPWLPQSSISSSSQKHRTRAKSRCSHKSLSSAITARVPSEPPQPQPAPQRSSATSSQAVTGTRSRAGSTTQRSRMSLQDSNPQSRTRPEPRPPQSSMSSSSQNHRTRAKSLRFSKSLSPAIKESIENGQSQCWRKLWSNLYFADKALKDCVNVIHIDIVRIWDLDDKDGYLSGNRFKIDMSHVVEDLAVPAGPASSHEWNGPKDNFADWVYDAYRGSQENVRCLMGYIINLTVILDGIFRTTARNTMENTARGVMDDHIKSGHRDGIHRDIRRFVAETFPDRFATNQDSVLEEIIRLIVQYCS